MSDAEESAAKVTMKIRKWLAYVIHYMTIFSMLLAKLICTAILLAVVLTSLGVCYQLFQGVEVASQLILTPIP